MTTFTTLSRGKTNWQGPNPARASGEAFELLIGSGYKLNIGSGFNLTIAPEYAPISWTRPGRAPQVFPAPAPAQTANTNLNIGSNYELLIGSGYKLITGDNSVGKTPWSTIRKSTNP